jgi:hypothetical protein
MKYDVLKEYDKNKGTNTNSYCNIVSKWEDKAEIEVEEEMKANRAFYEEDDLETNDTIY